MAPLQKGINMNRKNRKRVIGATKRYLIPVAKRCSDLPLSSIPLGEVADHELRRFARELCMYDSCGRSGGKMKRVHVVSMGGDVW